ncbi:TetR/AcrR family transcriptional regulator [Phenylobacterium sp. SCN 70-31]|uniref:TetR/AcrR family transcriptional regulator n=1 Tax=Phenylobacterium sp. SCN 70-31 TaxID=1660129 RepID=UPI00086BEC28|nr:TetR/AcrR family transcriptional regulator [Phenylobacterium sp. SCN 70-31]ODT88376.1 MAG: hypothetical protein ABS78_07095 [Phenylobacterium sp. SCN 70-31]
MSSISALLPDEAGAAGTHDRLLAAAAREFNTVGFYGTNTNKIARAAGFAPQTFYRHFEDKTDAFIAVYGAWQAQERGAVGKAVRSQGGAAAIARGVLQHHVDWRIFRRSLRLLAVEDARVRRARRGSREQQVEALERLPANTGRPRWSLYAALLTIERLCDAAADGELEDLGVDGSEAIAAIAAAIADVRGEGGKGTR